MSKNYRVEGVYNNTLVHHPMPTPAPLAHNYPFYPVVLAPNFIHETPIAEPLEFQSTAAPTDAQPQGSPYSGRNPSRTNTPSSSSMAPEYSTSPINASLNWDGSFYGGTPSPDGYWGDVSTAPSSPGSMSSTSGTSLLGPESPTEYHRYALAHGAGSDATDPSDDMSGRNNGRVANLNVEGNDWASTSGRLSTRPRTARFTSGIQNRRSRTATFICEHVNCVRYDQSGERVPVDFTTQKAFTGKNSALLGQRLRAHFQHKRTYVRCTNGRSYTFVAPTNAAQMESQSPWRPSTRTQCEGTSTSFIREKIFPLKR